MDTALRHADARTRFVEYRARAEQIWGLTAPGPSKGLDRDIADLLGLTMGQLTHTRRLLVYLEVLTYEPHPDGGIWDWSVGTWQEVSHALHLEMERQMRGGLSPDSIRRKAYPKKASPSARRIHSAAAEVVAVATDSIGLETGAVVGPDAPQVITPQVVQMTRGPEALVMAAKQYRGRTQGVDVDIQKARRLVAELREMGLEPPAELAARTDVKKDTRLEAIVEVLPYIESLERMVAEVAGLRAKVGRVQELERINQKQREQIERLISGRVADAMRPNLIGNDH